MLSRSAHLMPQVEDVGAILIPYHPLLVSAFNCYVEAVYEGDDDTDAVTLNGWVQFAADIGIIAHKHLDVTASRRSSHFLTVADVDITFRQVDSITARLERAEGKAPKRGAVRGAALNRAEFIAATITLATLRFMRGGETTDVSEAVEWLMRDHLSKLLAPERDAPLVLPDDFRRKHAYTAGVNEVLCEHEAALRMIFDGLVALSGNQGQLVSFRAWKDFVRGLDLIGYDTSDRDAARCCPCQPTCNTAAHVVYASALAPPLRPTATCAAVTLPTFL